MAISKNTLQARINNLSSKTGVHQNILLKAFFFDAFLKRLAASKYASNFVFKGGFLLSSALGVNQRSTMDMDFLIQKIELKEEAIAKVMSDICAIDVDDSVRFEWEGVEAIRQEDRYGGFRANLLGRFENIKETVPIDIATGDPITPQAIIHRYKCLLDDEVLCFQAYNFETILAEKLQTVLVRGVLNSRSKDFFDLFIIHQLRWDGIDQQALKDAFAATCTYRGTHFSLLEALNIIDDIQNDKQMGQRWEIYRKKNKFVGDISFQDAIGATLIVAKAAYVAQ